MAFVPGQNNNTIKEYHKNNKYSNTMKVKISSNNQPIKQIPLKCDQIQHKKSYPLQNNKKKKDFNVLRKSTNDMSATEFMLNVKIIIII